MRKQTRNLHRKLQGKEIERTLRSDLQFLETLINTMASPVFYKDMNGCYRGCNESFATLILGLPKDRIIGNTIKDLPYRCPKNSSITVTAWTALIQSGEKETFEMKFPCADGTKKDFLVSRAAFGEEGGNLPVW